jgi:O-antigen ligase
VAPAGAALAAPGGVGAAAVSALRRLRRAGYWPHATVVALLCLSTVGVRVHEGMTPLAPLKPVLLTTYIGTLLVLLNTRSTILARALKVPLLRLAGSYVFWAALTAPFALWVGGAVTSVQSLIPPVLCMLLVLACPPERATLERLQSGIVWAAALGAVLSKLSGVMVEGNRLNGIGSFDSNDYAVVMAMALPLALGKVARSRGSWRLAYLGAACLLLWVLTLTGSRGGFIALVGTVLVFVLGQRGRRRFGFLALTLVVGTAVTVAGPEAFRNRVGSLLRGEEDYNYTDYYGRKAIWKRARGYALANPILGVGLNNFSVAEGETCKAQKRTCRWMAPHSAYYQSLAELGFPGGLLFVALLGVGAVTALPFWVPRRATAGRAPPIMHRPEYLAALVGFSAGALFLSHAFFPLLFGLLGLIALLREIRRVEVREAAQLASVAGSDVGHGVAAALPPARPAGRRGGLVAMTQPALGAPRGWR